MSLFRPLDPAHTVKPLDFGNGRVAGSVAPDGRLLSLSTYHPGLGYITLSSIPPFPDQERYNPAAVRSYRQELAAPAAAGFGLTPEARWDSIRPGLLADALPCSELKSGPLQARVITWASVGEQPAAVVQQQWILENQGEQTLNWPFRWELPVYLNRASMTQLTEGGIIPLPVVALSPRHTPDLWLLEAPTINAAVAIQGAGAQGNLNALQASPHILELAPGEQQTLQFTVAFADSAPAARQQFEQLAQNPAGDWQATSAAWSKRWQSLDPHLPPAAQPLAHRAWHYILACCALPVDDGLCLLTDHQILPLSWTRDAYYTIQPLLASAEPDHLSLVRRHLLWLFERAARPDGYWGRAYLPNGRLKDPVFQLDQQCYPLLELAEYVARTGDEATFQRLRPALTRVLEAILARQAPGTALFATEETPADDPMPLPYHFSSHILLWHTLAQLAPLNEQAPFSPVDLTQLARDIHQATRHQFNHTHDGETRFAYAIDLEGHSYLYHDANDLPLALAPLWGFCPADDPIWQATVQFAFSTANIGGYYPGEYGGLGSVHTPGAWPLGDVQELLIARQIGDEKRGRAALQRLLDTACWDGALPEARDPDSGKVRSRHWFAWPGAALLTALTTPVP